MSVLRTRWFDMIGINSVNGHEAGMADYVAGQLRAMGLEPHYSYFPEDAEKKERPSVWAVFDTGRPGKTMMLIGHIDTVGVTPERWNTDPFTPVEKDGVVYGRGSMDMKGGDACILDTIEHFVKNPDGICGKILICFVSDEEGLSKGTYQLVAEGITADYAIMAECRYDNVAVGFRGRYSFEVTVHGKSAHSSHYPEEGENALISGGKLAAAIEALPTAAHPDLKHGTWCVRYITGGNAGTLVVPDSCYLLVTTLQKCFTEVTGKDLPVAYDPSVCDSNILAVTLGIPTVTFGPSGENMHGANEYAYPWQVDNCAAIYKKVVAEMLKG